jgi:hypothetical protein
MICSRFPALGPQHGHQRQRLDELRGLVQDDYIKLEAIQNGLQRRAACHADNGHALQQALALPLGACVQVKIGADSWSGCWVEHGLLRCGGLS